MVKVKKISIFLFLLILTPTSLILAKELIRIEKIPTPMPVITGPFYKAKIWTQDKNISEFTKNVLSSQTLASGRLYLFAPSGADFSDVNLNEISGEGIVSQADIRSVVLVDLRRDKPGWTVTATCTHFINEDGDIIDVNNLIIDPQKIVAIWGSLDGVNKGPEHNFTGPNDPALLMQALPGYGKGIYVQYEILKLFIDVSTAPGTYTATMTFTVQ
ncbi:hypothetical protein J7K86_02775 [bacterium]|nr:hypothetical protein [bacterium]